jgi:hypothetical protein
VKNDYDVKGYIPQRIQLIFVGVITFAIIELFLFPRSSKRVAEKKIMEFFSIIRSYLEKAGEFAKAMQALHADRDPDDADLDQGSSNNGEQAAAYCEETLEALVDLQKQAKAVSSTLKKELSSALLEPYFGFSQKLHSQSLNGLVNEICEVEVQSYLIVEALKNICNRNDSTITMHDCPRVYFNFLEKVSVQMEHCCDHLAEAYPDGRLRPQEGNTLKAITAAASFRDFHDVRFDIVSSWSENCRRVSTKCSTGDVCTAEDHSTTTIDPNETIVLGIATSFLLELCRHLQDAGMKMETYAQRFPAYN